MTCHCCAFLVVNGEGDEVWGPHNLSVGWNRSKYGQYFSIIGGDMLFQVELVGRVKMVKELDGSSVLFL